MPDFDDLLTDDWTWWQGFAQSLRVLEDWSTGQLVLWPVDDFLDKKRYVPCPRRGRHLAITECWLCYGDWAWGRADLVELLASEASA